MTASDIERWHDFFLFAGGAGATLLGLIFVALTINLQSIMHSPGATGRAGSHVLAFCAVVFVAGAALIPDQSAFALGTEIIAVGLGATTFDVALKIRFRDYSTNNSGFMSDGLSMVIRFVPLVAAILTGLATGVLLILGVKWAMVVGAISIALLIFNGLIGSWRMLVEFPIWIEQQPHKHRSR